MNSQPELTPFPVAIKTAQSRDPGARRAGRGVGSQGTLGTCDTCAATHREQRLTGLAVFILMGVSVFMAPVLKVGSLAGVASFPRQGVAVPSKAGGSSP